MKQSDLSSVSALLSKASSPIYGLQITTYPIMRTAKHAKQSSCVGLARGPTDVPLAIVKKTHRDTDFESEKQALEKVR